MPERRTVISSWPRLLLSAAEAAEFVRTGWVGSICLSLSRWLARVYWALFGLTEAVRYQIYQGRYRRSGVIALSSNG